MPTLTCPDKNINLLSPNGFIFSIAKLPELSYFCQRVTMPMVEVSPAELATPFSNVGVRGERLSFGDLSLQIIVDSEMKNYRAMHKWLTQGLLDQTYLPDEEVYSDGTLTILNGNNSTAANIRFTDIVPVSLSEIEFVANNQDVEYITCNVTFRYSAFEFI